MLQQNPPATSSHIPSTDSSYPTRLLEIPDYPDSIYVTGNSAQLTKPAIAVVGSRAMTPYGEAVCQLLVTQLTNLGYAIVSGLATGIDSVAHRTALECGGTTIAVVANGLHPADMYPQENLSLANKIIQNDGVMLSEYPVGTKARRFQFPARNRIIAGLSVGTVVIEAKLRSGALITARRALEYNREVFAVPGSIMSPQSTGTNRLIHNGAVLVNSVDDIVAELQHIPLPQITQPQQPAISTNAQLDGLNEESQKELGELLNSLAGQPCSVERIRQHTDFSTAQIAIYLTELEIRGIVRKNIDFTYSLTTLLT